MYHKKKHDMTAFGRAVKEARERQGLTREDLAEKVSLSSRYIMYIETRGQHTSLQKLYEIATLFNISIDQFFFPSQVESRSTRRRQLDAILDRMSDKELNIVAATANAILDAQSD